MKLLPLPLELIQHIVSYDRALSVKKIPKTGPRYNILHTCAPRYQTFILVATYMDTKFFSHNRVI